MVHRLTIALAIFIPIFCPAQQALNKFDQFLNKSTKGQTPQSAMEIAFSSLLKNVKPNNSSQIKSYQDIATFIGNALSDKQAVLTNALNKKSFTLATAHTLRLLVYILNEQRTKTGTEQTIDTIKPPPLDKSKLLFKALVQTSCLLKQSGQNGTFNDKRKGSLVVNNTDAQTEVQTAAQTKVQQRIRTIAEQFKTSWKRQTKNNNDWKAFSNMPPRIDFDHIIHPAQKVHDMDGFHHDHELALKNMGLYQTYSKKEQKSLQDFTPQENTIYSVKNFDADSRPKTFFPYNWTLEQVADIMVKALISSDVNSDFSFPPPHWKIKINNTFSFSQKSKGATNRMMMQIYTSGTILSIYPDTTIEKVAVNAHQVSP